MYGYSDTDVQCDLKAVKEVVIGRAVESRIRHRTKHLGSPTPIEKLADKIYPPRFVRMLECEEKDCHTKYEESHFLIFDTCWAPFSSRGLGRSASFTAFSLGLERR